MATTLNYGKATTCLLDSTEATQLRPQLVEPIPRDHIVAQVRTQLREPIGYPPLAQATIPGDRVALAVELGIPQQLAVVEGALQALRDAGVEEELITILLADPSQKVASLRTELAALGYDQCQIKVHDPDNEKENAFLGVSPAGQAMRLNRDLCEADLVLPITVASCELPTGVSSPIFSGLFPEYSDRETIERLSAAIAEQHPAACLENIAASEQCGRQLGVGIILQIVPAPGGQVASVLAGDPTTAAKQAEAKFHQIWSSASEVRANLVIATLTGDVEQQTWQNVARAIAAAEAVLEPDGSIVICSELAEPVGRALSQLAGNDDYLVVERQILRNPSSDAFAAMQICRTLQRGAVYLRSQLRSSVVESLGITPIESDSELERLSQSHRPCVILEEAQRLLPSVIESEA